MIASATSSSAAEHHDPLSVSFVLLSLFSENPEIIYRIFSGLVILFGDSDTRGKNGPSISALQTLLPAIMDCIYSIYLSTTARTLSHNGLEQCSKQDQQE